ncbi:phosphopantothenoylcysteine decarboxylase complex subunit VHS3 SKDI_15G2070 [Saccharomyces kudriavzevii IFO 1802]|uniref:Flavoprotein domain-containing protein n=1 Tax=Saccharomyces kudriavzevii (strain ATCC MYA-4449 / AS 2.2408 / CBS 8840 / NBRC 1802 / NCYC 2889) TaxID=226230 RepID=A0AA35NM91_SACK1|nr:uncharacterized protein SKDI_15G2070 [Saccharomyces kudriavzevii IFO 1802]CAI4051356.1 hypothetical protein SKDI_15G2070 [Saccharomyces kudriavzevii IFO 1802]
MTKKCGLKNDRKGLSPNALSETEQTNVGPLAAPDTNTSVPFSSVSNIDNPVVRKSTSPTGSQTKSIMNASGTSGAVVSNTPEPGLKRIPTVTFSDSKLGSPRPDVEQTQPSKVAKQPSEKKAASVHMASDNNDQGRSLRDINTKVLKDGDTSGSSFSTPTSILSNADAANNISSLLAKKLSLGGGADSILNSDNSSDSPRKEHPHFYVEDPLHTPSVRSRSNSTSPRPSIVMNTFNPINIEREGSITKTGEPTLLESVLEEAMSPNAVSNPLRKENIMTNMDPRLPQDDGRLHVLFGATGSLSVFKLKHMIRKLEDIYGRDRISIQVILTDSATKFFAMKYMRKNKRQINNNDSNANSIDSNTNNIVNGNNLATIDKSTISKTNLNSAPSLLINAKNEEENQKASTTGFSPSLSGGRTFSNPSNAGLQHPQTELPAHIQFWTDQDEWDVWQQRTDPVLHIELRRWADILVVAPLTANTLAKIALGLCDNLLTSVIRAWNPMFPIFLAPSMGSGTFNSIMTKKHFRIIQEEMPWVTVFKPSEKVMGINGDIGLSGMMDANEIVGKIVVKLGGYPDIPAGKDEEEEDEDEDNDDEDDNIKNNTDDKDDEEEDDEEDDDEDDDDDDEDDDDENGNHEEAPQRP